MTEENGLRPENAEKMKAAFVRERGRLERLATELVGTNSASSAVNAAEREFIAMLSDIAYRDNPLILVRTGTIALGATHCDFRYQARGEPEAVANLYPDRIRVQRV